MKNFNPSQIEHGLNAISVGAGCYHGDSVIKCQFRQN